MTFSVWSVQAQVTTSGLSGFIKDGENKGLPGASVKAVHIPSGTVYGTMTHANGNYVIQGMRPGGPYSVEIVYLGMSPLKIEGIELPLGESYILNKAMTAAEEQEIKEVQIVGNKSAILNSDRTGAATNGNYSFKNTVRSFTAELNSNFNSRLFNQFLATYSRIQYTRETPGDIFPFVDIW